MFGFLKTAVLSVALGLGALGAAPAMAQSGVYLGLGGGHRGGPQMGIWLGDSGHSYRRGDRYDDRRWDDRRYSRGDDRRWDDRRYRACEPGQALNKAARMGLRRVQLRDVRRNSIVVSGRDRGERVIVRFARAPGCPVIGERW